MQRCGHIDCSSRWLWNLRPRGYAFGALLMPVAAIIEWQLGIDTKRKAPEDVTAPLSAEEPTHSGTLEDRRESPGYGTTCSYQRSNRLLL